MKLFHSLERFAESIVARRPFESAASRRLYIVLTAVEVATAVWCGLSALALIPLMMAHWCGEEYPVVVIEGILMAVNGWIAWHVMAKTWAALKESKLIRDTWNRSEESA